MGNIFEYLKDQQNKLDSKDDNLKKLKGAFFELLKTYHNKRDIKNKVDPKIKIGFGKTKSDLNYYIDVLKKEKEEKMKKEKNIKEIDELDKRINRYILLSKLAEIFEICIEVKVDNYSGGGYSRKKTYKIKMNRNKKTYKRYSK